MLSVSLNPNPLGHTTHPKPHQVVQFAHFSVKESLRSERLAAAADTSKDMQPQCALSEGRFFFILFLKNRVFLLTVCHNRIPPSPRLPVMQRKMPKLSSL